MACRRSGSGPATAGAEALDERERSSILLSMALACAMLCCSCSNIDAGRPVVAPVGSALQAEPRGIVGELCPPALAAKGYC